MLPFKTHGSGSRCLLLLHGASQSGATWQRLLTSTEWQNYRFIVPDLPGHGDSPRSASPDDDYTLPALGRALAGFMNAQALRAYLAVGTSLGCNVLAEALPALDGCRGIFLIGASLVGSGTGPADVLRPNADIAPNFMAHPTDSQLERYLDQVILDPNDEAARKAYKADYLRADPEFRRVLSESVSRGEWSDETGALASAARPLAMVFGSEDAVVQPAYADKLRFPLWNGSRIPVAGAGHSIQLDAPAVVADLLRKFADDCFR